MRRAFLLTLVASAAACAAPPAALGEAPVFLDRPMNDWIKDLSDSSAEVRRGAAFALGKIGGDAGTQETVAALTHSLRDKDSGVRDFAASGLGDVLTALKGGGAAYWAKTGPVLQEALKDDEPRVRRSAAYALGAFGPVAAPTRDDLIAAAADESALVRQNAAFALGRLGKEAGQEGVAQLRKLLKDEEPLVRRDALHALGEVGNPTAHPGVPDMLKAVGSERNGVVRKAAVEALAHLVGPDDRPNAGELYPLLKDKDSETRYNAAFVLGFIGGPEAAAQALPVLLEALKGDDAHFQEQAAAAIGGFGKDAAPAVEDLGQVLVDCKDAATRTNAALALAHVGPPAAKALSQLLQALQDNDPKYGEVRPYAVEALVNIHMPGVEPAIPTVLKLIQADPDPVVRQRCLWTLFDIRDPRDLDKYKITPVLLAVLDETDPKTPLVRYDSARLLALCFRDKAPDKAADVLLDMLTNRTLFVFNGNEAKATGVGAEGPGGKSQVKTNQGGDARYLGAMALGWMAKKANRPDIVKALEEAAGDDDPNLKAKAKEALGLIK